jgi:hypothetical protein
MGYLVSIVVSPGLAQLAGVVLILILMSGSGANPTLSQLRDMHMSWFADLSVVRWCTFLMYAAEIAPYGEVYNIQASLDLFEYNLEDIRKAGWIVFGMGLISRILALFFLVVLRRDKKK